MPVIINIQKLNIFCSKTRVINVSWSTKHDFMDSAMKFKNGQRDGHRSECTCSLKKTREGPI